MAVPWARQDQGKLGRFGECFWREEMWWTVTAGLCEGVQGLQPCHACITLLVTYMAVPLPRQDQGQAACRFGEGFWRAEMWWTMIYQGQC